MRDVGGTVSATAVDVLRGRGFLAVTMKGGLVGIAPQCFHHAIAIANARSTMATNVALT